MTQEIFHKSRVFGSSYTYEEWLSLPDSIRYAEREDDGFKWNIFDCCCNPNITVIHRSSECDITVNTSKYKGLWYSAYSYSINAVENFRLHKECLTCDNIAEGYPTEMNAIKGELEKLKMDAPELAKYCMLPQKQLYLFN